jgi:hypothetical protein
VQGILELAAQKNLPAAFVSMSPEVFAADTGAFPLFAQHPLDPCEAQMDVEVALNRLHFEQEDTGPGFDQAETIIADPAFFAMDLGENTLFAQQADVAIDRDDTQPNSDQPSDEPNSDQPNSDQPSDQPNSVQPSSDQYTLIVISSDSSSEDEIISMRGRGRARGRGRGRGRARGRGRGRARGRGLGRGLGRGRGRARGRARGRGRGRGRAQGSFDSDSDSDSDNSSESDSDSDNHSDSDSDYEFGKHAINRNGAIV